MSTVRILLEVHSTDERTPQELADIAAGRLTSCLGVDQSVQEPVKGSVMPEWGMSGVYDNEKQSRLNGEMIATLAAFNRAAQNVRPLHSYDDLRNAVPYLGPRVPMEPVKMGLWQRVLAWL